MSLNKKFLQFKFKPKIKLDRGLKYFKEYAEKVYSILKNFKNTTFVNFKATMKESTKFPV